MATALQDFVDILFSDGGDYGRELVLLELDCQIRGPWPFSRHEAHHLGCLHLDLHLFGLVAWCSFPLLGRFLWSWCIVEQLLGRFWWFLELVVPLLDQLLQGSGSWRGCCSSLAFCQSRSWMISWEVDRSWMNCFWFAVLSNSLGIKMGLSPW